MDSFKVDDNSSNKNDDNTLKGKNAIDILHKDISKDNEKNINLKISDIYGVEFDEANEIHMNYHTLRIKNLIKKSDILYKMSSMLENYFDITTLSSKVVTGEITENSCLDILINAVKNQAQYPKKDRYINFYN
ncbi:MAG: hypothetical protein ABJB76_01340 [Candidatus Nitrosocosmicus sp.]